jgi:hypothetical protein
MVLCTPPVNDSLQKSLCATPVREWPDPFTNAPTHSSMARPIHQWPDPFKLRFHSSTNASLTVRAIPNATLFRIENPLWMQNPTRPLRVEPPGGPTYPHTSDPPLTNDSPDPKERAGSLPLKKRAEDGTPYPSKSATRKTGAEGGGRGSQDLGNWGTRELGNSQL